MICVDKIYVAHYSRLKERKKNLEKQLKIYNLECLWIEQEPSDTFTKNKYSSNDWDEKFKKMNQLSYPKKRQLRKAEISLEFKHIKIYQDIVNNNIDTALILEDDAIFEEDFLKKFNFNINATPKDWDFIFIGSGCNLRIDKEVLNSNIAYKKEHPASKCTDSYIIKKEAAAKILETIFPFTFPIDFELNYQMFIHDMNVYWWEPPIVYQGSQNGVYRSEIQ